MAAVVEEVLAASAEALPGVVAAEAVAADASCGRNQVLTCKSR